MRQRSIRAGERLFPLLLGEKQSRQKMLFFDAIGQIWDIGQLPRAVPG